jgi:hypothetical protein
LAPSYLVVLQLSQVLAGIPGNSSALLIIVSMVFGNWFGWSPFASKEIWFDPFVAVNHLGMVGYDHSRHLKSFDEDISQQCEYQIGRWLPRRAVFYEDNAVFEQR